jgi:hypothetical protein
MTNPWQLTATNPKDVVALAEKAFDLLGYEPSKVRGWIFLADYCRGAFDLLVRDSKRRRAAQNPCCGRSQQAK